VNQMPLFDVSSAIVSPESASNGDYESQYYEVESAPLRDCLEILFQTRTSQVDSVRVIEANDSDPESVRWLTVFNGIEFETGAMEQRSLHYPESLTPASRARLTFAIVKHFEDYG
jgi:hypothetical protein